jgi:hypothetical protein
MTVVTAETFLPRKWIEGLLALEADMAGKMRRAQVTVELFDYARMIEIELIPIPGAAKVGSEVFKMRLPISSISTANGRRSTHEVLHAVANALYQ